MPKIKVIFFDLGSTLIYSKNPWLPIYKKADLALATSLSLSGIKINRTAFHTRVGGFLSSYYENFIKDNIEKTSFSVLREILVKKGIKNIPDENLRSALKAMYAVTQQNWYLEEDAISTLKSLKSRGYHLGLISNTSDDANVQEIVDRWGIRLYFEFIITSAALGIRKPDPRIFKVALDYFDVQPQAAVMVGDMLNADVLGANQIGIYSIWITRRVKLPDEGELTIQPQAVVTRLDQIPELLIDIEKDFAV
jgi:HAD superfamily hydrolase (TIGR01662 family)